LPAKGSVPPTGTAGSTPATSTPTGTASRASRSALTDPDGTTKDIIIIVGVIVAALLILTGWRAARRG
jgi:cobalamin biosynthesis Mg chelatase CobN